MTEEQAALEPGVRRDLRSLRWSYQGAYEITVRRGGIWRATRTDNGERVEADTAAELRAKIRADYAERRVHWR